MNSPAFGKIYGIIIPLSWANVGPIERTTAEYAQYCWRTNQGRIIISRNVRNILRTLEAVTKQRIALNSQETAAWQP